MQMKPLDLRRHLRDQPLKPAYLLHGAEPLQKMELQDQLLARARRDGFSEREIIEVATGFDWNALAQAADSLSLFAERRIIELRMGDPAPGREATGCC